MSNDPLPPKDSTFVLSFVLPDGTKITQEAPTDAYLWDILTRYQTKFKTNLLSKQDNNGNWLIPSATFENIKLSTLQDWHKTAKDLNLHKFGSREILFTLSFINSGFQIFDVQSQINDLKNTIPKQRSVTANDINDIPDQDTIMESTINVNNNGNNNNNNNNNNNSNANANNHPPDVDMFDNASRRPHVSTSDSPGYERIYTETMERMGKIGHHLYTICKDIDTTPKFQSAQKTLKAIVSNLLKPNCTERHRKLRLTNEKLISNLLQYQGSKEFLFTIGFIVDKTDADHLIYPQGQLSPGKELLNSALKQINSMQEIERVKPIPKVERDIKVYHSDELHKYRIAHSGLDELDEKERELQDIEMNNNNNNNNNNDNESRISGIVDKQSKFNKKNNNPLTSYMQSRAGGKQTKTSAQKEMERRAEAKALKMAMQDSKIKNKLKNPDKLMSEAKRKELLGIKDKEFSISLIQVEFPSKLVLEGKFHPREPISALADYVNKSLDPNLLKVCPEFKLVLPPREELKDFTKSFREMSMIPACTVRFVASPPATYRGRYLKDELCAHVSTNYTAIKSEVKEDDSKQNNNGRRNQSRGQPLGSGGSGNSSGGNRKSGKSGNDARLLKLMGFGKKK